MFFVAGKSYTMLGSPDNANTLGIIPCAISWLFKGINEQKQKTGARFSVRVSALEVCGPTNQMRDLLAGYANGKDFFILFKKIYGNCHFITTTRHSYFEQYESAVFNFISA